jgi:hypothetical protein
MRPAFDLAPELTGETLHLRPLRQDDFEALHAAASDPATWAGHPARNRHERDVFRGYFDFLLAGGGTLAIIDRSRGRIIGCSRYYAPPDRPDEIAIGFTFIDNAYWGGATNFELKRLMLGHAFSSFDTVWFHIDPTNLRSQRATGKLGAVHAYDATLDLSGTPVAWMCFRLDRDAWETRAGGR